MNAIPHLCLIDASAMFRRAAFVAESKKTINAQGTDVGATKIFSTMLLKLMRTMEDGKFPATSILACFDPSSRNSWRRALSADYKAKRPALDPGLAAQTSLMKEMCTEMGIAMGTCDTHEADDMIAAYTEDAVAAGWRVSIISSDKDLMQLVRQRVFQLTPGNDGWMTPPKVEDKFGVSVEQLGDYLALMGDATDGIEGAKGVGKKTAAAMLNEIGTLEHILNNPQLITREKIRMEIEANADLLRLGRALVTLDAVGCPRPFTLGEIKAPRVQQAEARLKDWMATRLDTFVVETGDSPSP